MSLTLVTPAPDEVYLIQKQGDFSVAFVCNADVTKPASLSFRRTDPKPSGSFLGVNRHEIKLQQQVALADASVVLAIATVATTFPAGMTDAQCQLFLDRLKDIVVLTQTDDLVTKNLLPYNA